MDVTLCRAGFTKDCVNVLKKLVGASNHDHLVELALIPFLTRNIPCSYCWSAALIHTELLNIRSVEAVLNPAW